MVTPYSKIYDAFLAKITDDMYMELDKEDTMKLLRELLEGAIHWFEFPRFNINARDDEGFDNLLSFEEINIIAVYMVVEWLSQQLASIEVIRMKYSGSDFKFTSQANHMGKLQALRDGYKQEGFHLQRLYKRRKVDSKGVMRSTFGSIMSDPD